jgi:hypothetical protein
MAGSDTKIEDFAEELGRLLGTARAKAEGWLGQRKQIAKTLEGIRDTASKLLADLGHTVTERSARRGRPPAAQEAPTPTRRPGRPKGSGVRRKMSAKARKAISDAQKKRWAKRKAGQT